MIELRTFSYKHGRVPTEGIVIDCREMKNPFYDRELRPLNGLDPKVQRFCMSDPNADGVVRDCVAKALAGEAVKLAFGCTGGTHRSVTMAEKVGEQLARAGCRVKIEHLAIGVTKELP